MFKVRAFKPGFETTLEISGEVKLSDPPFMNWEPVYTKSDITRFFEDQRSFLEALLQSGDYVTQHETYKFTMENDEHLFEGCFVTGYDETGGMIRFDHHSPKRRD